MGGGGEEGKERVGAAAVEGAASRTGEWAAVAARWWVTGGAWMIEAVRRTSQKRKSFELRGEGCVMWGGVGWGGMGWLVGGSGSHP